MKWSQTIAFFSVSKKLMTSQKAGNRDIRGLKKKTWKELALFQFVQSFTSKTVECHLFIPHRGESTTSPKIELVIFYSCPLLSMLWEGYYLIFLPTSRCLPHSYHIQTSMTCIYKMSLKSIPSPLSSCCSSWSPIFFPLVFPL